MAAAPSRGYTPRMVRVRIGPSPTGDPHVGTAYIALFNYVFARQSGGQFILRIEDTDMARSSPAWEHMIVDALRWLGLDWDEGPDCGGPHGPYRQSERSAIYRHHAGELMARGGAYRCFCSAERLAELRLQQRQRGAPPGYDGCCRHIALADAQARAGAGEAHVVRLRVPADTQLEVPDRLRGTVRFDSHQLDDQVLLKSDGMPTYHLANVVDDHLMGITHVIRAEEWLTSSPKHLLLYAGFGWEAPQFVHMPLLRNPDKSKISKRKNPVSLNYYREAGFLPSALLNYLGMMGWTMPDGRERFSVAEMTAAFTFDRISLGGPIFDVQKLTWLNGLALREMPAAALIEKLTGGGFSPQRLAEVMPLVHARMDKLEDFFEHTSFFFTGDVTYAPEILAALVPKNRSVKEALAALEEVLAHLDAQPQLLAEPLEAAMRALCERLKWPSKELFMSLRLAVSGRRATPPLFETMAVLGKERCRRRLRQALLQLRRTPPPTAASAVAK